MSRQPWTAGSPVPTERHGVNCIPPVVEDQRHRQNLRKSSNHRHPGSRPSSSPQSTNARCCWVRSLILRRTSSPDCVWPQAWSPSTDSEATGSGGCLWQTSPSRRRVSGYISGTNRYGCPTNLANSPVSQPVVDRWCDLGGVLRTRNGSSPVRFTDTQIGVPALRRRLGVIGIRPRAARATALGQLAQRLPQSIPTRLTGLAPSTTVRWNAAVSASYAGNLPALRDSTVN